MTKVSLISNQHALCGNADYGRDVQRELEKEFEVTTCIDPWYSAQADVAFVNWHPARVQLSPQAVQELHNRGMKVIVVLQNSFSGYYEATEHDPLRYADLVIAHQPMKGNINFVTIPVGIRIVDNLQEPGPDLKIGIAGFPFAWKRFDLTAAAAHHAGGRSLLIAPQHDMGDTLGPIRDIHQMYPTADIVRDYFPSEEVIRMLSSCTMNIFWYQHMPPDDLVGQSGSVRMGVAARRPMIISTHPKLRTVADYDDEIYVASTEEEVHVLVKEIWTKIQNGEPVKRPKRIIEEMGWDKTGQMYRDLVRQVAAA